MLWEYVSSIKLKSLFNDPAVYSGFIHVYPDLGELPLAMAALFCLFFMWYSDLCDKLNLNERLQGNEINSAIH
jgi:hypothetical protein